MDHRFPTIPKFKSHGPVHRAGEPPDLPGSDLAQRLPGAALLGERGGVLLVPGEGHPRAHARLHLDEGQAESRGFRRLRRRRAAPACGGCIRKGKISPQELGQGPLLRFQPLEDESLGLSGKLPPPPRLRRRRGLDYDAMAPIQDRPTNGMRSSVQSAHPTPRNSGHTRKTEAG